MFSVPLADEVFVGRWGKWPGVRGAGYVMQSTGSFQPQVQRQAQEPIQGPRMVSGMKLIDLDRAYVARPGGCELAGVSAAWRKLLLQAEMAAPHVQVASIEGESGVGKHALARYLLSRSPLSGEAFHRHDAREWLLREGDLSAAGGFIYLDRVDLLAPPGQGLLLAVLKNMQDRGGGRRMVVASSESPLRQLAGQGQLLPDLAFRLTAVRFAIPPLRMRREDIPPIAQSVLENLCARYQHRPMTLSPAALGRLLQHAWPGNVRELASALESALLEATGDVIRPEDLALQSQVQREVDPGTEVQRAAGGLSLDEVIQRHVQYVLDLNHGNKLRSSRQLRISRSTLYRILAHQSVL